MNKVENAMASKMHYLSALIVLVLVAVTFHLVRVNHLEKTIANKWLLRMKFAKMRQAA